jgi:hypothetical protein
MIVLQKNTVWCPTVGAQKKVTLNSWMLRAYAHILCTYIQCAHIGRTARGVRVLRALLRAVPQLIHAHCTAGADAYTADAYTTNADSLATCSI